MEKFEHPKYKGYFCNKSGEVFNGDKLLRGTKATVGYWQHYIKGKTLLTHRFVYECCNNCLLGTRDIINHLDHDKLNNDIRNLEKTDQRGNVHHYFNEVGFRTINHDSFRSDIGQYSSLETKNSKISKEQATELIYLSLQGVENDVLGKKFGLHPRYVSLIRHKKRWGKLWVELGLESSETIPSGSRPASAVEAGCPT